jgi:hypothetical protein
MTNKTTTMQKNATDKFKGMALPPGITAEMMAKAGEYNPPDFTEFMNWTPAQTGFAPYFEPAKGVMFAAVVERGDMRDPNFERYLFAATHDTICRQGAKPNRDDEDAVDTRPVVIVPKDGHFTLGVYYALRDILNALLMYQHENNVRVPVYIKFTEKLQKETKNGRHPWQFEVRLHPDHARGIEATKAKLLGNEGGDLPMLPQGKSAGAAS